MHHNCAAEISICNGAISGFVSAATFTSRHVCRAPGISSCKAHAVYTREKVSMPRCQWSKGAAPEIGHQVDGAGIRSGHGAPNQSEMR